MSEKSFVIVSVDCEGLWGLADTIGKSTSAINEESLSWAYTNMIEAFAARDIPATLAFVSLFASDHAYALDGLRAIAHLKSHRDWVQPALAALDRGDAQGWLLPLSMHGIKSLGLFEIASHGYTHLPLGSHPDAQSAFQVEISGVSAWEERHGLQCQTYVFPRNQVAKFPERTGDKWLGFRDANMPSSFLGRAINEVNLWRQSQSFTTTATPMSIPGGQLMNWRKGFRRLIPERLSVLRWRSILRHARMHPKRVAHLWFHPHNLITGANQLDLLETLLDEITALRNCSELEVVTQVDFTKYRQREHF